ncbi:MAG TPA: flagellar basal body rod protein FlgB [Acidobacteriaceae bacterium]|jgi:flagellar basal-body rod protein FlgB
MTPQTSLMSSLESYVKLSSSREQLIAANMANVDTPGYHTRDINFERELKRATEANMTQTEFGGTTAELTPATMEVSGLLERPDGNNVDLDREGLMLAQTQLQNQMGVQLIKHYFHGLMSAINGGGN